MNAIATALATAASDAIRARIWEGRDETRVYIAVRNGSRNRPWLDKGYIRITSAGTAADYRAERTLDWRSDDVEHFADRFAAALTTPADRSPRAIMTRAWAIAREASARFGGSSRSYFVESLRQAWAEAR